MTEPKHPVELPPFCAKDIDCQHQWFLRGTAAYKQYRARSIVWCRKCGAESLENAEIKPKPFGERWSWAP